MDRYKVITISDKKVWEDHLLKANPRSFLQSWNWGETNKMMGNKVIRLGVYKKDQLLGVCQIIKEDAKRGPHFIIPGGPLINWNNRNIRENLLHYIKVLANHEKVWFVRIRPEIIDSKKTRTMFKGQGFIPANMHLHAENTWVLDISKDGNQLLADMRKSTRYLIKKSLKAGLNVTSTSNPEHSIILKRLQDETVKRHNFTAFPAKLFKYQLETFGKDDQSRLYLCKYKEEYVAAAIIIFYGDTAYYHHSASTSKYKDVPFSYFLQWSIINDAKNKGMKYYNFWGIAPDDNPKHRFAGVTLFKKGFGGERMDWLHAHDIPTSYLYWATRAFEYWRKRNRHL
jgi:lipid II:glycine glycyltransferase (peptidoglycan interpeptide bridge formation enzyme)